MSTMRIKNKSGPFERRDPATPDEVLNAEAPREVGDDAASQMPDAAPGSPPLKADAFITTGEADSLFHLYFTSQAHDKYLSH